MQIYGFVLCGTICFGWPSILIVRLIVSRECICYNELMCVPENCRRGDFFSSKLYRVDLFGIWSNMEISVLLCPRQIPTNSASQDAQGWLEDQVWSHRTVLPKLFGPWGRFHGRQFFHGPREGNGFGMIHSHYIYYALCHSSVGKESTWDVGEPGSIPGSGRSAGEGIGYLLQCSWASLVAQLVKNLCWEDHLDKGKATHSSILAWRIPWTKSMGSQSLTWLSDFHFLSNLMSLLIWQKVLVSGPEAGDPCERTDITLNWEEMGSWVQVFQTQLLFLSVSLILQARYLSAPLKFLLPSDYVIE